MNNTELDTRSAAHLFSDEIQEMRSKLQKAEIVLDDITTKYFGSSVVPEGSALVYDYTRYSVKAYIVSEYLCELKNMFARLEALTQEGSGNDGR